MRVNAKWRRASFASVLLQYNDLTQRIHGTTRSDEDVRG